MANSKSAQKRVRQSEKRAIANRASKTRVRSARKAMNAAITSGDKMDTSAKFQALTSVADKAAKKGAIHKNSANRLKGLYAQRIANLG